MNSKKISNCPDPNLPQCLKNNKQNDQPLIMSISIITCNEFTLDVGYFIQRKKLCQIQTKLLIL